MSKIDYSLSKSRDSRHNIQQDSILDLLSSSSYGSSSSSSIRQKLINNPKLIKRYIDVVDKLHKQGASVFSLINKSGISSSEIEEGNYRQLRNALENQSKDKAVQLVAQVAQMESILTDKHPRQIFYKNIKSNLLKNELDLVGVSIINHCIAKHPTIIRNPMIMSNNRDIMTQLMSNEAPIQTEQQFERFIRDLYRVSQSQDPSAKAQARDFIQSLIKSGKNLNKNILLHRALNIDDIEHMEKIKQSFDDMVKTDTINPYLARVLKEKTDMAITDLLHNPIKQEFEENKGQVGQKQPEQFSFVSARGQQQYEHEYRHNEMIGKVDQLNRSIEESKSIDQSKSLNYDLGDFDTTFDFGRPSRFNAIIDAIDADFNLGADEHVSKYKSSIDPFTNYIPMKSVTIVKKAQKEQMNHAFLEGHYNPYRIEGFDAQGALEEEKKSVSVQPQSTNQQNIISIGTTVQTDINRAGNQIIREKGNQTTRRNVNPKLLDLVSKFAPDDPVRRQFKNLEEHLQSRERLKDNPFVQAQEQRPVNRGNGISQSQINGDKRQDEIQQEIRDKQASKVDKALNDQQEQQNMLEQPKDPVLEDRQPSLYDVKDIVQEMIEKLDNEFELTGAQRALLYESVAPGDMLQNVANIMYIQDWQQQNRLSLADQKVVKEYKEKIVSKLNSQSVFFPLSRQEKSKLMDLPIIGSRVKKADGTFIDNPEPHQVSIGELVEFIYGASKYVSEINGDIDPDDSMLMHYKKKVDVFKSKIKKKEPTKFDLSSGTAFKLRVV